MAGEERTVYVRERERVLARVQPKVHLSITAYLKAKYPFELVFVNCMFSAVNLPHPFGTTALSAAKISGRRLYFDVG